MARQPKVFIDTETNGDAIKKNLTDVYCIGYKIEGQETRLLTGNYHVLQDILNTHTAVFHNASFDIWVLESIGLKVGLYIDTMLLHYVLYPNLPHGLEDLGYELGIEKLPFHDFENGYSEEMGTYCKRDVEVCEAIFHKFFPELVVKPDLLWYYANVELPFVRCVIDLETNGVMVDRKRWAEELSVVAQLREQLHMELVAKVPPQIGKKSKTKKERPPEQVSASPVLDKWCPLGKNDNGEFLWGMWEPFNPDSPAQVKNVLELESSDVAHLEDCPNPLATEILELRKVSKLVSTYGETLLDKVHLDGRLRARFNQAVTLTGRLSSSSPNLQNIPSRGEYGDKLRSFFVASPGHKLVSIDCDAFQMRIYAWYLAMCTTSPDGKALLNDFNTKEDADPHQAKADVLGIERRVAKTLNFASLFGASPDKAARLAKVTVREMEGFFKKQEEMFPSDAELKRIVVAETKRNKARIYDAYGRQGFYPNVYSEDWGEKSRAERQAFNFIIQATEASVMKCITIECRQRLLGTAKLVLQVHDEILFECPEDNAEQTAEVLNEVVRGDWLPGIRLWGTASIGDNWFEVH